MRYLLALAVVLAACHHPGDTGSAWPKRADREQDGGESLAPRVARSVASPPDAAVLEDKPTAAVEKKDAPPGDASKPSVTPVLPPIDDSLFGDDLTIEVED